MHKLKILTLSLGALSIIAVSLMVYVVQTGQANFLPVSIEDQIGDGVGGSPDPSPSASSSPCPSPSPSVSPSTSPSAGTSPLPTSVTTGAVQAVSSTDCPSPSPSSGTSPSPSASSSASPLPSGSPTTSPSPSTSPSASPSPSGSPSAGTSPSPSVSPSSETSPSPSPSPEEDKVVMVFVGANSFVWKGSQVVPYLPASEWWKRPLSGVRVHFGCSAGGDFVVRFTAQNGIAGLSKDEAEDLGCSITNMQAHLAGLNHSDGQPNKGQPTYDFYYEGLSAPSSNLPFSVPAQNRKEDPIVKKIGIRPTVQGQVTQKSSGKAVTNRQVCVTYRTSQDGNGQFCDQPTPRVARRDATDGNGRYMLYTSWGDIARNRASGYQGDTVWLASGSSWKASMFSPNSTPILPMQGAGNTRNGQTVCTIAEQFYTTAKSKVGQIYNKVPGTEDRGPCDTFVRREVMLPVLGPDMRRKYGINHPAGGARNLMQELEALVQRGGAEKIPLNQVQAGDIFYNYPSNDSTTGHVGIIESPGRVIDAVSYPSAGGSKFIVNAPHRYSFALAYRICE